MLSTLFHSLRWDSQGHRASRRPRPQARLTRALQGRPFRPCLDFLEDRTLPTTFMVMNTQDSGLASLRAAILAANANPGSDTLLFTPAMGGTITLTGGQLSITDGLTLLGPVIVNILLFHIFLEPTGLPIAIVVSLLALFLLWRHRANFAGLVKP